MQREQCFSWKEQQLAHARLAWYWLSFMEGAILSHLSSGLNFSRFTRDVEMGLVSDHRSMIIAFFNFPGGTLQR